MSRLLVILATFVGLMCLARDDAVPKSEKNPVLYFPTRVGDRLVYQWLGTDIERVEVVTAVEEKEGSKLVSVGHEFGGEIEPLSTFVVSGKGVAWVAGYDMPSWLRALPPLWLCKSPPKSGERWVSCEPGWIDTPHTTRGIELVTVPAGEFKAIRVETEIQMSEGQRGTESTWYAPRVGIVKVVSPSGIQVLKSFTPGNDRLLLRVRPRLPWRFVPYVEE